MRRKLNIYLAICVGWLLAACDVVSEADQHIAMEKLEGKHLIIEFTGVRCVNCPKAAEEAHRLLEKYPENVIVVEMHPKSNPFTEAIPQYDYTCPEADTYYRQFGGTSSTPFPKGVIDFQSFGNSYFQDFENWETMLMKAPIDSLSEVAKTVYWLVEDSIVGAQADGNITRTDYVHNHVLRAELPGIEGLTLQKNQYVVAVAFDEKGNYLKAEKIEQKQ